MLHFKNTIEAPFKVNLLEKYFAIFHLYLLLFLKLDIDLERQRDRDISSKEGNWLGMMIVCAAGRRHKPLPVGEDRKLGEV